MSSPRRPVALLGLSVAAALLLPATAAGAAPAQDGIALLDVTSDVQGDLADWGTVLDNYASFEPADALVVNGDLVAGGKEAEYEDFFGVLDAHPHADQTFFTIGNHEFYGGDGTDAAIERFRRHTGQEGVYNRTEVDGVPVLGIGSTQEPGEWAVGNQVVLGDAQLEWLEAQLDAIPADRPVLVFGHHPLPAATSGTIGEGRQDYYDLDYREIDRLLEILGRHPNVVFFSGHTHYSLHREDGTNRVTVPGGHADGFLSVNTGAVQTEWGPEAGGPNGGEWAGPTEFKQNLRVRVEGSRVTITYLDHATRSVIRELTWDVTDPSSQEVRTDVAWPRVSAGEGRVPVTATIPGPGDGTEGEQGPGSLVMSIAPGGLDLADARDAGDRLRLSGALPQVEVTDSRAESTGWAVTGQSSPLAAGSAVVRAGHLGWAPFLVQGRASAGAAVDSVMSGGAGLGAPATLGSSAGERGSAALSADVELEVPVDTKAGHYQGAMTVSLFPQD